MKEFYDSAIFILNEEIFLFLEKVLLAAPQISLIVDYKKIDWLIASKSFPWDNFHPGLGQDLAVL